MTTQSLRALHLRQPAVRSDLAQPRRAAPFESGDLPPSPNLPRISPLLLWWFTRYSRRYLRRHFHSLRVSRAGRPASKACRPLVIYSNHASWWDPLVCLVLKEALFPKHTAFSPMDATMLARYGFFKRLGFFGVEPRSPRGAAQFLLTAEAVLHAPNHLLALTPQACFVDARQRPVRFAGGIGYLAERAPDALFVPVALEYVFWEERLPEILVRFGEPTDPRGHNEVAADARYWTRLFEQQLAATQDALAAEAQRRCADDFECLLRGGGGPGGVYDQWRALKARCRGETFHREHGNK